MAHYEYADATACNSEWSFICYLEVEINIPYQTNPESKKESIVDLRAKKYSNFLEHTMLELPYTVVFAAKVTRIWFK